ncbi:MFS transporter [Actinoplanes sp. CA-142083]|uniref:MFS transporter n=1 Tax=Actinoplanes sp. CA-142083 TaxID=3239903 RepID=UPI003D8B77BF
MFAVSGAVQASWMSRLPAILEQTHADLVRLGVAFFLLGLGTLTAMVLTGPACDRYGGKRVLVVGFAVALPALVAIGFCRSPQALAFALLAMGIGSGIWDAGMNVQGYAVESGLGKHLMSSFHGWWSVGSMTGAGLGLVAARLAIGLAPYLVVVSLLAAVLCAMSLSTFDTGAHRPETVDSPRRRPVKRLATIAVLMFCGALVEGGAGDWLAVYLSEERNQSHSSAALGYTVFVTAMATGRLVAERPHRHVGAAGVVRAGAVVAGIGIGLVVFTTKSLWAFAGAFGWGIGICWAFPAALSAAGNIATASAVAMMTAIGYCASIFGPLAIGWLAHAAGLGTALLGLLPLVGVVALLSPILASRK